MGPLGVKTQEPSKLPTPIKVQTLAQLLKGYHDADYICDGFRQGFKLEFQGNEAPLSSVNSWSAVSQPDVVTEKLSQEAEKGRIAGPFSEAPFKNFKASPLALRPKPEPGKFRLLHNLSYRVSQKFVLPTKTPLKQKVGHVSHPFKI